MRLLAFFVITTAFAQQPQISSPMVEHTRTHERLPEKTPAGKREKLDLGTLYLPPGIGKHPTLFLFFHGESWVPEVAAARNHVAVISATVGNGSGVYVRLFEDPQRLQRVIAEAEEVSRLKFARVIVGGWSAGCGAVRQILRSPEGYARVDAALCIDGMHTDYVNGQPGPLESSITPENIAMYVQFGRDAMAGRKKLLVTHSEIFPGTYASTTETADYLVAQLGVKLKPVLKWGPRGSQQLSEASRGKFLLKGFAGNSAPDHVDQLQSLPEFLKWLR